MAIKIAYRRADRENKNISPNACVAVAWHHNNTETYYLMGSGCNRLNLLYLQGTKRKSHRWLSHCVDGYRQSFIPSKTVRFLFIFNSVSDASFCTAVIAFCFFGRVEQQSKELLVAAARRRAAMQQAVSLTIVYSVMSILYFLCIAQFSEKNDRNSSKACCSLPGAVPGEKAQFSPGSVLCFFQFFDSNNVTEVVGIGRHSLKCRIQSARPRQSTMTAWL